MTFIYVTHDQEEALTMSDRIAVFNQGKIEQIGHARPRCTSIRATEFVAGFIGTSNMLERGRPHVHRPPGEDPPARRRTTREGEPGTITAAVYLGRVTKFVVALDGGGELVAVQQNLETSSSGCPRMEGSASGWPGARTWSSSSRRRNVRSEFASWHVALGRSWSRSPCRRWRLEDNAVPTSVGAGEGKLTLVAWEGYTEKQWVTPFEKQTGCKVHGEVRRQLGRDGQPDALGRRRPVRHGLGLR